MSDVEEPAVDALSAELKKVQSAATVPVLDVQGVATCRNPTRSAPVWMGDGPNSLDNIPPLPTANVQDVEHWLNCRNCEMRNVLEQGDVGTGHQDPT